MNEVFVFLMQKDLYTALVATEKSCHKESNHANL